MTKQDVVVELQYGGVWNEVPVYTRTPIRITHGQPSGEGGGVIPSTVSLTLDDREGLYDPSDPLSPLFGLVGRNTPIRIILDGSTRFYGEVVAWRPDRSVEDVNLFTGRGDAWVEINAAGQLHRIGQGADLELSALFRTITGANEPTYLLAYWALEEGGQASRFNSSLPNNEGLPMNVPGGLTLADDDTLPGSLPLPTRDVGSAAVVGQITRSPITGTAWTFDVWAKGPEFGSAAGAGDVQVTLADGSNWSMFINSLGDVQVFHRTSDGSATFVNESWPTLPDGIAPGEWHNLRLVNDGGDIELIIDGQSVAGPTAAGLGLGVPAAVEINPRTLGSDAGVQNFGHSSVWDGVPADFYQAGLGWVGEKAADRFQRLCDEAGID